MDLQAGFQERIGGKQSVFFRYWLEEVRADAFEAIVHAVDKIKAMVIAAGASAVALRLFGEREAVPGASDGDVSSQMLNL